MAWEFRQGIPIWRQLVRRMEISIAAGEYQPDEKIPSVRDLALEAGVNPNTMQRALTELVAGGILYSERTAGRFVTGDTERLKQLRRDLAEGYVEDLFRNLGRLGMSLGEIDDMVHDRALHDAEGLAALAGPAGGQKTLLAAGSGLTDNAGAEIPEAAGGRYEGRREE